MSDLIAAGLAETIRALRSELTSAMESGADERLHFELGAVHLEGTVAITREGLGDAGIRFGIVSFGQKVDLRMKLPITLPFPSNLLSRMQEVKLSTQIDTKSSSEPR